MKKKQKLFRTVGDCAIAAYYKTFYLKYVKGGCVRGNTRTNTVGRRRNSRLSLRHSFFKAPPLHILPQDGKTVKWDNSHPVSRGLTRASWECGSSSRACKSREEGLSVFPSSPISLSTPCPYQPAQLFPQQPHTLPFALSLIQCQGHYSFM